MITEVIFYQNYKTKLTPNNYFHFKCWFDSTRLYKEEENEKSVSNLISIVEKYINLAKEWGELYPKLTREDLGKLVNTIRKLAK